jgi:hypothetical protein
MADVDPLMWLLEQLPTGRQFLGVSPAATSESDNDVKMTDASSPTPTPSFWEQLEKILACARNMKAPVPLLPNDNVFDYLKQHPNREIASDVVLAVANALFQARAKPKHPCLKTLGQILVEIWKGRDLQDPQQVAKAWEDTRKKWMRLGQDLNANVLPSGVDRVRCHSFEAAGLLLFDGLSHVLLGVGPSKTLQVPGGKAVGDEDQWRTAQREFREEVLDAVQDLDWKALDTQWKVCQYIPSGRYWLHVVTAPAYQDAKHRQTVLDRFQKQLATGAPGPTKFTALHWWSIHSGTSSSSPSLDAWTTTVLASAPLSSIPQVKTLDSSSSPSSSLSNGLAQMEL